MKNILKIIFLINIWRIFLSIKPQNVWKILLKHALTILKSSNIPMEEWTFGGGTALMLWFNHRISLDIDLFFTNAQYLNYLTPRLNDTALSLTDDYTESSNFLKLRLPFGEIDFIIAPHLTPIPFEEKRINNNKILIETPEEIIMKKLFYRTEGLKVRDLIDSAVVIKNREKNVVKYLDLLKNKKKILKERLNKIKEIYDEEVVKLHITDKNLSKEAITIVEKFFDRELFK